MPNFFDQAQAGDVYVFLTSGSPPIFVRLMALNALFLGMYAVRKASGAEPMSAWATLLVQLGALGCNLLVLYQAQVETDLLEVMRSL